MHIMGHVVHQRSHFGVMHKYVLSPISRNKMKPTFDSNISIFPYTNTIILNEEFHKTAGQRLRTRTYSEATFLSKITNIGVEMFVWETL